MWLTITQAQLEEVVRNGLPKDGEMILEDGRRVPDPAFPLPEKSRAADE